MSLANKLRKEFGYTLQSDGIGLFRSSRVKIVNHSRTMVAATVDDDETYLVKLSLDNLIVGAACTCVEFEAADKCEHIWAVILETDRKTFMTGAYFHERLSLAADYESLELLNRQSDEAGFREISTSSSNGNVLASKSESLTKPVPKQKPEWQKLVDTLSAAVTANIPKESAIWPPGREVFYIIDGPQSQVAGKLIIELVFRERKRNGEWGKFRTQRIPFSQIPSFKDERDRQVISILAGAQDSYGRGTYYGYGYSTNIESLASTCRISSEILPLILPLMCATERCRFRRTVSDDDLPGVAWDDGDPWEFLLKSNLNPQGEYEFNGVLRRGEEEIEVPETNLIVDGLLIGRDFRAARLDASGTPAWISALQRTGKITIPAQDADELLEQLLSIPGGPKLELPNEIEFNEERVAPRPHVVIKRAEYRFSQHSKLDAQLLFDYEVHSIHANDLRKGLYDKGSRRLFHRDFETEHNAAALLKTLGFKTVNDYHRNQPKLD